MSKLTLVTIYDTVARAHMPPSAVRTPEEGVRVFEATVKQQGSRFADHPEDFILYHVGEWDEIEGVLIPLDKHIKLATASDFISKI